LIFQYSAVVVMCMALASCSPNGVDKRVSTTIDPIEVPADTLSFEQILDDSNFVNRLKTDNHQEVLAEINSHYQAIPESEQYLHFHLVDAINTEILVQTKDYSSLKKLQRTFETNLNDANKSLENSGSCDYNQIISNQAGLTFFISGVFNQRLYEWFESNHSTQKTLEERNSYREKALNFYHRSCELNPSLKGKIESLKEGLETAEDNYQFQDYLRRKLLKNAKHQDEVAPKH